MSSTLEMIHRASDGDQLFDAVARYMIDECGNAGAIYGFEPAQLEAVYALGYSLYNQGRWVDALRAFNFLAINDHLDRRHHMGRGACLQTMKRHEDALRAYGVAFLLEMTDPLVTFHMGECLIALGRIEDAQVALDASAAAAEGEPAHALVERRALALVQLLKRKEAA